MQFGQVVGWLGRWVEAGGFTKKASQNELSELNELTELNGLNAIRVRGWLAGQVGWGRGGASGRLPRMN